MDYKKLQLRNIFGKPVKTNIGEGGNGVISVSVLPNTGEVGKIYYNTTDGKYYVYSDGSFKKFSADVVISAGLPQTGEAGTLYYNTLDGKYYCYDGIGFKAFVTTGGIPIITVENTKNTYVYEVVGDNKTETVFTGTDEDFAAYSSTVPQGSRDTQGFYLESNKFYDLGTISPDDDGTVKGGLRLYCVNNSIVEVKEYIGRFTVASSENNLSLLCLRCAATADTSASSTIEIIVPDDTPDLEPGHTYEFNISASVLAIKDITAS